MTEFLCTNCGTVYDVYYEGEHIWRVQNPKFRLVVTHDGNVHPTDYQHSNQIQASIFPLCVLMDCILSSTKGILTDEPIEVILD